MNRTRTVFLSLILAVIVVGAAYPRPAHAFGFTLTFSPLEFVKQAFTAVVDGKMSVKEFGLDPAAWLTTNVAVQGLVNRTLTWALEGNNGAPTVNTNPLKHLLDISDTVQNDFLQSYLTNSAVKSPNQVAIATALRQRYFQCTGAGAFFACNPNTLSKSSSNPDALLQGDLKNGGGLSGFFALALNPGNNPLGQVRLAQEELGNRVASQQGAEKDLLSQGNGFLPIRTGCPKTDTAGKISLSVANVCLGSITTNGHIIAEKVNKALGSGLDRLIQSDEFDEVLADFVGNKLFAKGGLLDLNKPATSGGRSALDEQTAQNQALASAGPTNTDDTGNVISVPTGNSSADLFYSTVAGQYNQLSSYVRNLQKINSAAVNAQAVVQATTCVGGTQIQYMPRISAVLGRYPASAVSSASQLLSQLNQVVASASLASQTGDSGDLDTAQNLYADFTASGTLPSVSQVAGAEADAQDSTEPLSAYTEMGQITDQVSAAQADCSGT